MQKFSVTVKYLMLIILGLVLVFLNNYNKQKQESFKICKEYFENGDYQNSAICFKDLYDKYKIMTFKYNQANSLFLMNDFENAKKVSNYILKHETKNQDLIKDTNDILEKIKSQQNVTSQLAKAKKMNIDNYYALLSDTAIWKNPMNIKVYYEYNEPKTELFKRAFDKWNDVFRDIIHFEYVKDAKDADITCYYVEKIDESPKAIGMTNASHITYSDNPNVKYLKNAKIRIAYKHPITQQEFSDDKMLSTITHEIGHALGIAAHSPDPHDIMYEDDSNYQNTSSNMSYRDINTMKILYGKLFK